MGVYHSNADIVPLNCKGFKRVNVPQGSTPAYVGVTWEIHVYVYLLFGGAIAGGVNSSRHCHYDGGYTWS